MRQNLVEYRAVTPEDCVRKKEEKKRGKYVWAAIMSLTQDGHLSLPVLTCAYLCSHMPNGVTFSTPSRG